MGLISFILDKFVLKRQCSYLGGEVYPITLTYRDKWCLQGSDNPGSEKYTFLFDTLVWAHDVDEAVERAKEKWMESERKLIAEGARGIILVPKERMRYSPNLSL